jgi:hypothetical protein
MIFPSSNLVRFLVRSSVPPSEFALSPALNISTPAKVMKIFADNELEAIRLAIILGVSKYQYAKAKKIIAHRARFSDKNTKNFCSSNLKKFDSDIKFFNSEY